MIFTTVFANKSYKNKKNCDISYKFLYKLKDFVYNLQRKKCFFFEYNLTKFAINAISIN